MATCSYCKSTIVLGGVRSGDLRFCNTKCLRRESLPLVWTKCLPWVFLAGGLVIRWGYIVPTFMFLDALFGAFCGFLIDCWKVRKRWSKTTQIGFCIGFIGTVFLNLPSLKLLQDNPVWNLAVVIGMGLGGGAIVAALVGFVDGFIGGLKGRGASSDQKDLRR